MRILIALLAVLFFRVLDPIRALFSVNLGALPSWLKLLYIRVLVDRLGYPFMTGEPERVMNRRQRRALYFGVPRKMRPAYLGLVGATALPLIMGAATIAGSRSGLFWKQTPGSLPVIQDAKSFAGNIYFVDSGTAQGGTSAGYGLHPDKAFTTIDSAIDQCTTGQGDAVFVLAGHAESIVAAGGITLDKIGVSVVGLGVGNNRPTITFATLDTGDVEVDSASCGLYNLRFVVDVASLAAAIDVDAAGFVMEDCDFYGNNAAAETALISVITDANANQMAIRRCSFNWSATLNGTAITTTSTECIRLVGADHAIIEDCYISGDFTTAAINGITTASLDIQILRNRIHNIATENIAGIVDLVAGCNGVIAHNHGFMGYTVSLAAIIDPASCAMIENYFSNVVTEAGGLVGTAST